MAYCCTYLFGLFLDFSPIAAYLISLTAPWRMVGIYHIFYSKDRFSSHQLRRVMKPHMAKPETWKVENYRPNQMFFEASSFLDGLSGLHLGRSRRFLADRSDRRRFGRLPHAELGGAIASIAVRTNPDEGLLTQSNRALGVGERLGPEASVVKGDWPHLLALWFVGVTEHHPFRGRGHHYIVPEIPERFS